MILTFSPNSPNYYFYLTEMDILTASVFEIIIITIKTSSKIEVHYTGGLRSPLHIRIRRW